MCFVFVALVLVPLSPPRALDLLWLLPPFFRLALGLPSPTDPLSSALLLCNRIFGVFYRKLPLLFSRQFGILFRNPTLSYVLFSITIQLWSFNPGFFKPIIRLLSLAFFPQFSCKFSHCLLRTKPHPSADTPRISIKLRFCFSPGFCVFCQVSFGLQYITSLVGPLRPPSSVSGGFHQIRTVFRTGPASSTHPTLPRWILADHVPAFFPWCQKQHLMGKKEWSISVSLGHFTRIPVISFKCSLLNGMSLRQKFPEMHSWF